MKVIFSATAKKQLREILLYFVDRNCSREYSDKLLHSIVSKLKIITPDVVLGVKTDKARVYRIRVENYGIEYQLRSNSVKVVAIFDVRRNINAEQFGL